MKLQDWLRQKRVKERYYHDEHFAAIDQKILSGPNPFKVSKKYLQELGEDNIYQYGETPLETLEEIGKLLELKPSDHLIEMGCGRGRGAFFLHHVFGCKVTGIEQIPEFVLRAKTIGVKNASFRCENMLKTSLKGITCIYLYGTCLDDLDIQRLINRFAKYPLRIATTSFPLPGFKILNQKKLQFPWGTTDVFITQSHGRATCAK